MSIAKAAAAAAPAKPAAGQGQNFVAKDISQVVPAGMMDIVQRVVAAGMHLMYAPQSRGDLMKAVQSTDPISHTIALNVVGLMLVLSKKAPSGIPPPALMPICYELTVEAGTVLEKAGKTVTQDDFNAALQEAYSLIGTKLGAAPGQIMDAANKALPPDQQVAGGAPPDGPAAAQPPPAATVAGPAAGAQPPGAPGVPPQPQGA